MRIFLAPALALSMLTASAHAEIVATSIAQPASNVYVVIELHNELAKPDICQGRTGFPMALIGMARSQLDPIQKAGVGCWAPDGAGNVVVTAVGYPNGNPLRAVKSISEFSKTEHFTDWNASPVSLPSSTDQEGDGVANHVERFPEGTMVTSLYDIEMPCPLGRGAYAGAVESTAHDGARVRVNGCWVRDGAAVSFVGHMPGGAKPFRRSYAASDFTGVIPSR